MPPSIQLSSASLDMSERTGATTTVVASPAAAAETIIASLTLPTDVAIERGVTLIGFAAYLIGAAGTAARLRLRETDIAGNVVGDTGAMNVTAADLRSTTLLGFDATVGAHGT